jgi:lipoate-protein ligase A
MSLFTELDVYHDGAERSAAMNMAVDEALLEQATVPSLRFYRWNHPALSFGYFGRFADVAQQADKRDLVRRWTGGGIVLHGEDLTYTVVIPASAGLFRASSNAIYAAIHAALRDALAAGGQNAELAATAAPVVSEACFAKAVVADVTINGRKVAGAAHRRTRTGLLHQGSIQQIDISNGLASGFAHRLSAHCSERALDERISERAGEIAEMKYATNHWLQRR